MGRPERLAHRTFSDRAKRYTTSEAHTDPTNLERLVSLAHVQPGQHVLDVATGTGHTALAVAAAGAHVVGVDLTRAMLVEANALARARTPEAGTGWVVGDAHALPFSDGTFDVVVCRRAAHHFAELEVALDELVRVVAPGGRLVLDDRSVPEDPFVDAMMNELDLLHDPSHVRQHSPMTWRALLDGLGLAVETVDPYHRDRPLTSLTTDVPEERVVAIHERLDRLDERDRARLHLVERDGELWIRHWYVLVAAHRGDTA